MPLNSSSAIRCLLHANYVHYRVAKGHPLQLSQMADQNNRGYEHADFTIHKHILIA